MGGLGKTTLARKLYITPNIASSFPTRAWMCVSQEYNTMDLLRNIIKPIQVRTKGTLDLLERMTEGDLEIYLRDLLKEHKYLVVVDDVWKREAWESLKRAFPDNKNGNRVIITTRKEDVAERADSREMESLAKDMVEKCRGLPLAIVVLSGLLSHKKGLHEWQKVKDHLWKNIKEDKSIEISNILSLSYNDLSTALKQCFLYFGIFPKDQVLGADNIIRLWMAEGFIPRGQERTEDVAEGFLNELIRRSLVQVAYTYWDRVTNCRVHDLLCDLAIEKALEYYSKPLVHIRKRTSLQVVDGICCDQWKDVALVDLVNLQELSMDHINKSYSLNNIRSLKNLSTLRLLCKYDGSFPSLAFVNCCEKLQKLWLSGRIEKLPHLFPNSITMMLLNFSVLTEDPMPILGMLPNLRNLDLFRAYEGKEIMCSDNNFSQLEFLHLSELEKLERWHLGTSAMPLIKGLHIHACPNLKEIPERMKDVELLKRNYMR
ncbi:hypothetical protein MTR67_016742 [Solanum verrucosum]|uniref:NB-ARC domain-containing protein n=1 Tax=Solanum verrucosum TaxID=315347 RepID=A0AAF0QID1_SOLVR|nr:hypothetical protein MTR67_016740 [Solanum verrucosum]WMV23357.1 hypothetical protein MTR67_016742 [Solanum verrucosum]